MPMSLRNFTTTSKTFEKDCFNEVNPGACKIKRHIDIPGDEMWISPWTVTPTKKGMWSIMTCNRQFDPVDAGCISSNKVISPYPLLRLLRSSWFIVTVDKIRIVEPKENIPTLLNQQYQPDVWHQPVASRFPAASSCLNPSALSMSDFMKINQPGKGFTRDWNSSHSD